jgi:hypothetical protein
MIAIRALPGAGKNFIATLLSKHYNINNLMCYDEKFNEYFHSSYLLSDDKGEVKHPFWINNKWKILNSKKIKNLKLVHDHDWFDDGSGMVRKFRLYNITNGKVGIDSNEFNEKITEGFFIFCNNMKDIEFIFKLYIIKMCGQRPLIVYNNKNNISTASETYESIYLRMISSSGNCNDIQNTMYDVNKKLSYIEWIQIWRKYCNFIKKFPFIHVLSQLNMHYISTWLDANKKFNLFDENNFLTHYELYKINFKNNYFKNINLDNEQIKLNQVRKLQKQNNMILHEINYKDLFLDFKPTGTVLDNYMDEIKEYTTRNMKLIEDYESFYGKIL